MEISERDKRLLDAIKESWKYTDFSLKLIIIGMLLLMCSLIGYGMRYLIEVKFI